MELLIELHDLLEKDTPGLSLGAFKLDTEKGIIYTKIGNKLYAYTPKEKNAAELFNSVTGMAKHSPGRALVYLKQHATGVSADVKVTEDLEDQTLFTDHKAFEDAVAATAVKKKLGTFSIDVVSKIQVYSVRRKYFAAWDSLKKKGIIDPDFKGKVFELIALLEKS